MFDIISIGDATEDVFVKIDEYKLHCKHGKTECMLCLQYASKIPATRVDKLIGGNASNVAIGSRRLGLKSAFYVELGDDDQGRKIFASLKKDKVDTRYVTLKRGVQTNYSVVINTDGERTILVYHVDRKYKLPSLQKAKWVYLTSMGKGCEVIYKTLLRYIKRNKAKLAFNPGTHQMKTGVKTLKPLLQRADIIFLNTEETQFLLHTTTRDFRKLCKKLWELNKNIAVVTDGPAGSYCYDGENYYFMPIFEVPIIERTGCGDSYSTAFMCALHYGKDIKEAMRWGTLNAASVIQQVGPQQGLTTKSFITATCKKHPKFSASELKNKEGKKVMYNPKKRKMERNIHL